MVMKIYLYGEDVLRQKASPVKKIDERVRELIRNMTETMRHGKGVGLAAPQVGELLRIIVAEVPQEQKGVVALVNPKILESSGSVEFEEGCLSVPGIWAKVKRAAEVTVDALTPEGERVKRRYSGLLARVVQHEIDHLEGILFVDHLSILRRSMVSLKLRGMVKANREQSR